VQKSENSSFELLELEMVDLGCFFEKNGLGPLGVKYYNINFFNKIKLKNCTNNVKAICDVVKKKCPNELRSRELP
jgi:hypothetical protein